LQGKVPLVIATGGETRRKSVFQKKKKGKEVEKFSPVRSPGWQKEGTRGGRPRVRRQRISSTKEVQKGSSANVHIRDLIKTKKT